MAKKKFLAMLEYFKCGDTSENKKRGQENKREFSSLTKEKIKARTSISNMSQETCRNQNLPMAFSGVLTSG